MVIDLSRMHLIYYMTLLNSEDNAYFASYGFACYSVRHLSIDLIINLGVIPMVTRATFIATVFPDLVYVLNSCAHDKKNI